MSPAAPAAALATPPSRPAVGQLARGGRSRRAATVVRHARHGSRRRWWSDAWEDDSDAGAGGSGFGAAADAVDELTTLFCSDGSVVQLGVRPHPRALERRAARHSAAGGAATDALPLPREQGLCIGSVFTISATNGIDAARRVSLRGFCFSTEHLFERVEETVLSRGGEVFETQRQLKSGVHECLHMSVAIPLLWGVPPEYARLKAGIKSGGGIIEQVTRQWVIY